jgi:Tfp pilus assembly protein PilN
MRIPVNLSSQPFQRNRAMLAASIAVGLALAAVLACLIALIIQDRGQMADVRQDIARMNRDIRRAQAEQTSLASVLARPENAEVLERSVFLNALLYRKGISWTRIFSDLEKVLPYNVKIVQIAPALDAQNRVQLNMTVASEAPEPEIQLLLAMENSPLFGEVQEVQQVPPTQAEPLYRYRITVTYAQL